VYTDFWTEIKTNPVNRAGSCRVVNGENDPKSIAQLFAEKYRILYSSVPCNKNMKQSINTVIPSQNLSEGLHCECIINVNDIKNAVACLNNHKCGGDSNLTTDHIINSGDDSFVHLACPFTSVIVHDTAPENCKFSTVVPIP
jgi:hypothetical protein